MATNRIGRWAALGVGMAVGAAAARILPPLLATVSGTVRTRMGEDPFQSLIQDHRKILNILDQMESARRDETMRRSALLLALKRTVGKHSMAEEDVLYPMLYDEARAPDESKHLFQDHAEIKIALHELGAMLRNRENWTARVRSLRHLIQMHARQEEDVEFPKLRQALGERRMQQLSGAIRREEAMLV
jgi:hemerythrin superfamily protein